MRHHPTYPYLPIEYDNDKANWNQSLRRAGLHYRNTIIIISYLIPLVLSLIFMLLDMIGGQPWLLPKYWIPLIVSSVLLGAFLKTRNTDFFSRMIVLIGLVGGLSALVVPGNRDAYLLIIFFFPTLALQLRGAQRGGLWILAGLGLFLGMVVLNHRGLLPHWNIQLTPNQSLFLSLAWMATVATLYRIGVENQRSAHTLQTRLIYDGITGLPSKSVLFDTIQSERNYLFLIISIENYQDLRNLLGYDMSDEILLHFRGMIDHLMHRMECYPFKLKGSEFGLLVPRDDVTVSNEDLMKEIHSHLCSRELVWNGAQIHIFIRLGAAEIRPPDTRSFLSEADLALEKARQTYRQSHIFDSNDEIPAKSLSKVRDYTILQKNLQHSLLQVYYQPIADARTRQIAWHEALLRLQDDNGAILSPFPFIELAEQLGMQTLVSKSLLTILHEDMSRSPFSLSLNMTHRDLLDPEFLFMAENFLEEADGRFQVTFEILESQDLLSNSACMNFITSIHRKNGLIALDDFGTGYSNLTNLSRIPFDILKFDGELIRQIEKNPESRELIAGVVSFCRNRGLRTVAEFVETDSVADILTDMGADYLQGYLVGKPRPLAEIA